MGTDRFTIAGARIETLADNSVDVSYTNGTYRDTNKFHPVNNVGRKRCLVKNANGDGYVMARDTGMNAVKHVVLLYVDVTDERGNCAVAIPGTTKFRNVTLDADGCYAFLRDHPDMAEWRDVLAANPPSRGNGAVAKMDALTRQNARLTRELAELLAELRGDVVADDSDDNADIVAIDEAA